MTAERSRHAGSPTVWSPNLEFSATPHELPGLYVHVPFCTRICPYCDFAVQRTTDSAREQYLDALAAELAALRLAEDDGAGFGTVYLGGGTPTALTDDQLERLVALVDASAPEGTVKRWRAASAGMVISSD